jgi:hypothetical protein
MLKLAAEGVAACTTIAAELERPGFPAVVTGASHGSAFMR